MNIDEILSPERACSNLHASSKKKAIELVSKKISLSLPELRSRQTYRGLIDREKLGTTAIGEGVAIPHCRLDDCQQIIGGLFVFNTSIDFSSPDEKGVNIIFALVVPQHESSQHLTTLAALANFFSKPTNRYQLLSASNDQKLYQAALKIGAE